MIIRESLTHALMITGFVFAMMLVIEYLNVLTAGVWRRGLRGRRWRQYLLAALLGATPGCLGAFAVVALYSHGVVTLGAVVAAMIATSGDEAFVIISMVPGTALHLFLLLFLVGMAGGFVTDSVFGERLSPPPSNGHGLHLHEVETCQCFPRGQVVDQLRHCTLARGVLIATLTVFLFGLVTNQLGPPEWSWVKATLFLTSGLGLFIVSTVPDHFLDEHLWEHVAKVHVPRVFLWTFGALLVMHVVVDHLHLEDWLQENRLIVLAVACLVGLIPESGPHLVFVTLFAQGAVPFSVLLASSVVQDGHGMLPVLADSRSDFVRIKAVNLGVGFLLPTLISLRGRRFFYSPEIRAG
jgi:hypothetical protein